MSALFAYVGNVRIYCVPTLHILIALKWKRIRIVSTHKQQNVIISCKYMYL